MRNRSGQRKHYTDGLFALLIFGVFAFCILSVLIAGASAYRRVVDRDTALFDLRTCTQYVATKLRNAESTDAVSYVDLGDEHGVCIKEDIAGTEYATYIYCHEGCLKELLLEAGDVARAEDGEILMTAKNMVITREGNTYTVTMLGTDNSVRRSVVTLRGGENG